MSHQVLLRFLNAGLLNLNGDDTKLAKLQEAAGDLAKTLQKTPGKTTSFALIAFDPQAQVDDPVILEAIGVLQKHWATYVNTFAGTPLVVIRAILLDALVQAADDENIGVAFVGAARNVLAFMEAANEQAIWAEVVVEIEQRVDARAVLEWATPKTVSVPEMSAVTPSPIELTLSSAIIDKETLAGGLQAAVRTDGGGYYSYHQNEQHNQQWAEGFGKHAAEVISVALEAANEHSETGSIDLSEPLLQLSQAVSTYVENTLKSVNAATSGLQRRTNLIWWKESLYSPSAHVSYRTLPPPVAVALMAFDLHMQVPVLSPASVVAFLQETALSLPDVDFIKKKSIRELFSEVINRSELANLRNVAAQLAPYNGGRGPVLSLLGAGSAQARLDDDESFRSKVGVPAATQLSLPEWAAWLFRELQAAQATKSPSKPKRRGHQSK